MSGTKTGVREDVSSALARLSAQYAASVAVADDGAQRATLEARARVLATPLSVHDELAREDERDRLVFVVGDERLGMSLASIVAIVRATVVTPLPRAVAPVYGVTAWRGRPLTVLSVGGGAATRHAESRLIVLGDGRRAVVGLFADAVEDTRLVRKSALSPARGGGRGLFAMGVTDDAVLVLDAHAMLDAARPEP
ncbi:MAG: chemotaxis protein CheW [bacterium]